MSDVTHATAAPTGHGHGHGHDDGAVHAHISSFGFMAGVFGALIFLTVVTVAVSYVDLGVANTFVAVLIATLKASLVAAFFMHLRHDKPFHAIILVSSFLFLCLFLMLTMDDLGTRGRVTDVNGVNVMPSTGAPALGSLEGDQSTRPANAPRFIPMATDPGHVLPPAAAHIEGEGHHASGEEHAAEHGAGASEHGAGAGEHAPSSTAQPGTAH